LLKGIYSFGANIYQKIPGFFIFVAEPHIFKATAVKFDVRVQTPEVLPGQIFVKTA